MAGFTAAARRLLATAPSVSDIAVLSGLLTHRCGAAADLAALLAAGPLPHATTLWGKSLVDETDPGFAGVYAGAASADAGPPHGGGRGRADPLGRAVHRLQQRVLQPADRPAADDRDRRLGGERRGCRCTRRCRCGPPSGC